MANRWSQAFSALADLGPAVLELEDRRSRRQQGAQHLDLQSRKLDAELKRMQAPYVEGGMLFTPDDSAPNGYRVEPIPAHLTGEFGALEGLVRQGLMSQDDFIEHVRKRMTRAEGGITEYERAQLKQKETEETRRQAGESRMEQHQATQEKQAQQRLGIESGGLALRQQEFGLKKQRAQDAHEKAIAATKGVTSKPDKFAVYRKEIMQQRADGWITDEDAVDLIRTFSVKEGNFAPSRVGVSTQSTTVTEGTPDQPLFSKRTYNWADSPKYNKFRQSMGKELGKLRTEGKYFGTNDPPPEKVQEFIEGKSDPIERDAAIDQAFKMFPKYKDQITVERLPLEQPTGRVGSKPLSTPRLGKVTEETLAPETPKAPTAGKTLDEATARRFLQQAGGDKEKARKLAREAGYDF